MKAVTVKTRLQYLSADPVVHALVQHLSSQLSIGEYVGYSQRGTLR